jgi:hypothetical protein
MNQLVVGEESLISKTSQGPKDNQILPDIHAKSRHTGLEYGHRDTDYNIDDESRSILDFKAEDKLLGTIKTESASLQRQIQVID